MHIHTRLWDELFVDKFTFTHLADTFIQVCVFAGFELMTMTQCSTTELYYSKSIWSYLQIKWVFIHHTIRNVMGGQTTTGAYTVNHSIRFSKRQVACNWLKVHSSSPDMHMQEVFPSLGFSFYLIPLRFKRLH